MNTEHEWTCWNSVIFYEKHFRHRSTIEKKSNNEPKWLPKISYISTNSRGENEGSESKRDLSVSVVSTRAFNTNIQSHFVYIMDHKPFWLLHLNEIVHIFFSAGNSQHDECFLALYLNYFPVWFGNLPIEFWKCDLFTVKKTKNSRFECSIDNQMKACQVSNVSFSALFLFIQYICITFQSIGIGLRLLFEIRITNKCNAFYFNECRCLRW